MKLSAFLAGCAALLFAGEALAQPFGSWAGEYTCAQGLTSMTLDVRETNRGGIAALATFCANPKNPGVPSGCFTMTGRYNAEFGLLMLRQDAWIQRPGDTWFMIDLDGKIDKSGKIFSGSVLFPAAPGACDMFSLKRTIAPPRPAGACGDALTS